MKKTQKQINKKDGKVLPDVHRHEEHHHHHDDKELYIIEADGNVKKLDLHREKEC